MVAFHLLYLNSLPEHDIDLSQVVGSGFEGRVTKKDLMSVIENGGTTAQSDKQVQNTINFSRYIK